MSSSWDFPGSRWWKVDFHTHTPASKDTSAWQSAIGTPDEVTPEKWLLRYMSAEIDCVAITDHNSGDWIDKLKSAYAAMHTQVAAGAGPAGFREIHILPGVEISVQNGFHLLAIFGPNTTTGDIDTLLGKVGYEGSKGDSDAVTTKGAGEVVASVLSAGGIPIPAHADQNKGLLQVASGTKSCKLDPASVKQVLETDGVLAMEWTDTRSDPPAEYERLKVRWARILGSDCHTFQGSATPGSRFTWVKMASPSLEGLRLALLDGNGISIRRSDEGPFDPFKKPTHFISEIEVRNARYMGNGEAESLKFTPFYNALIGGRGTGKSTIVHALRLTLNREDELDLLDSEAEPRKQFGRFNQMVSTREGEGALRENTTILVQFVSDDIRHRIRWEARTGSRIIETWQNDSWEISPSQIMSNERFPIRIFSQGQIAAMGTDNRQALLDVIDEAANVASLQTDLAELKRTYLRLFASLREVDGKLAGRPEVLRKIGDLSRKLATFEQSAHADVLKTQQIALQQMRRFKSVLAQLEEESLKVYEFAKGLSLSSVESEPFDAEIDRDFLSWQSRTRQILSDARAQVESAGAKLAAAASDAENDAEIATWKARIEVVSERYEALKKSLADEGVDDPQQFGRLEQERQELEVLQNQFNDLAIERSTLMDDINTQWSKIFQKRVSISQARSEFLAEHLKANPFVRIGVIPFGEDPKAIERSLRTVLDVTDDRFEADILQTDGSAFNSGLALDISRADDRVTALQSAKDRLVNVDEAFNGHFQNHLERKFERQPELKNHIQCWFPDDDLKIEYSRAGNGSDFTHINQGSQGQRAAALLAFLLSFGSEPLVLDQPEDDLDNHLIYELIVTQIRDNKLRRQLVIVTHNANVVVNGDSEMVHAFDFTNGQCRVRKKGALQDTELRGEVCHIMEGGPDAFEKRWARLGGQNIPGRSGSGVA